MKPKDIERFRGWSLAALYASMSVLSLLLILAAFQLWSIVSDDSINSALLVLGGVLTAAISVRTSLHYVRSLRAADRVPQIALMPFLFMAITLFAASNLFTNL